jgi:pilus assembly protein CpaB
VGGWVRPNDHVDVIGTFRDPQTNEQVAVTLIQNVTVLATGKITGTTNVNLIPEGQRDYSNVSLLVIPEEAEVLVLAQQEGKLTLSLRNEEDVDLIEERGRATIHTLLSGERTREYQRRRAGIIDVIRGNVTEKSGVGANSPQ